MSCVEALIHQSCHEINDDDMDGHTPLLLACQHGHQGCVHVLLALGADVSKRFIGVVLHVCIKNDSDLFGQLLLKLLLLLLHATATNTVEMLQVMRLMMMQGRRAQDSTDVGSC